MLCNNKSLLMMFKSFNIMLSVFFLYTVFISEFYYPIVCGLLFGFSFIGFLSLFIKLDYHKPYTLVVLPKKLNN